MLFYIIFILTNMILIYAFHGSFLSVILSIGCIFCTSYMLSKLLSKGDNDDNDR